MCVGLCISTSLAASRVVYARDLEKTFALEYVYFDGLHCIWAAHVFFANFPIWHHQFISNAYDGSWRHWHTQSFYDGTRQPWTLRA